jgi:hypothetical protein
VSRSCDASGERGIALIAVLIAMTLLLLLALPFSVSMGRGADAAVHAVEVQRAHQASASARDLLLSDVAFGHPTYDATPDYDDRTEFPTVVPDVFPQLLDEGRVRLGGEVKDLQRRIGLGSITPLLLGNLLGTSARLAEPLMPDSSSIRIDGGAELPAEGYVFVDFELIQYRAREGNVLLDLARSQGKERGFLDAEDHEVIEGASVFDYRTILAATWAFDGRSGGSRRERLPMRSPQELGEIGAAGYGAFSRREMDILERTLAGDVDAWQAPVWGRPERIFASLVPTSEETLGSRRLVVKSALHLGAGSVVRIRNRATGAFEYGLVMQASAPGGGQISEYLLPSIFHLDLLDPVTQEYPAVDTVVEPLVPSPVNINTASVEVLQAVVEGCRRGRDVRVHEADGRERPRHDVPITRSEAQAFAEEVVSQRDRGAGPLAGFEELAERMFRPRFEAASGSAAIQRWIYLYRNLLTGRDSAIEMGSIPVCFESGPLVAYRAAATVQRSVASSGIAARHERQGVAAAMPGVRLLRPWSTQERLEEAFRLDQRAPYFLTAPINTGVVAQTPGNDPASRYFAHVVGMAFPQLDFGEPRFPSRDDTDARIMQATASAPPSGWPGVLVRRGHESFAAQVDPRGWDIDKQGPFRIENTGPRGDGGTPAAQQGGHQLRHAFTTDSGGAGRFAVGAWFEPDSLAISTLIDYSDGDSERNRISLQARDGNLVFEVLDEAGLDPDPGQSPAGVPRTAATWQLPLADLNLPARTPVHLQASAYGNRPQDLVVEVDGMVRGDRSYTTRLSAPIDPLNIEDLQGLPPPGQFTASRDPRFLTIQVEDTEGFPPQGVLRIGLELFEYTSIQNGAFLCQFSDSTGGRARRQIFREMRDDIPSDPAGRPTVAIGELPQQANSETFPGHPAGALVELYGYTSQPSPLTAVRVSETAIDGDVGAFSVARGYLNSGARPITLQAGNRTVTIGEGLDETWSGDLYLADPVPTGDSAPPEAIAEIANGFPAGGGYALLMQVALTVQPPLGSPPGTSIDEEVGGIELIRYDSRQGARLVGVQRAQTLEGDNSQVSSQIYNAQAKQFLTNWMIFDGNTSPPTSYNDFPNAILWVVPVSLPMRSTQDLADPATTGYSEFVQLLPQGRDTTDTEWVRYDVIAEQRHLARGQRGAWSAVYRELTRFTSRQNAQVGGPAPQNLATDPPWGTVTATSGHIGYVPQVESDFPQIHYARLRLGFRGDPFTGTSSHAQSGSRVLPVHRFDLDWGNYSARTARAGRYDRVALVQGSVANGMNRPPVEWQTVNWVVRRFGFDNVQQASVGAEYLNAQPTQWVAFQGPVQSVLLLGSQGSGQGQQGQGGGFDTRQMDRMVKFPSGELPAAYSEAVSIGGMVSGGDRMGGIVDEVDVTDQAAPEVLLSADFLDTDQGFVVNQFGAVLPQGLLNVGGDISNVYPEGGGLVQIDDEVLAYQTRSDGAFVVAENGRGLLGTETSAHARGAVVRFLTQRPCAILSGGVQPQSSTLPVQALNAMPARAGTALLSRGELLHYTWVRRQGDQFSLEMPRGFEDGSTEGEGLMRGRFGTTPLGAGTGEPLISMPFRYWDRHVERSDDPELSYFQLTTREAPSFFRSLSWREETQDSMVDVACYVLADDTATLEDDPERTPNLWRFERGSGDQRPFALGVQATQLAIRFAPVYKPGAVDLFGWQAHGWKTGVQVDQIELDYEGEGRILWERVTAR